MNRLFYCTFMMAVLWLLIGCGGAPSGPTSVSRLPATDVRWPETKLRLPWNGESYRVPEPVVIPHQRLADGLEAWDRHRSAAWSILLEDGRTAVVATTRDQAAVLSMDSISVYRRDGSLQLEQRNDKGMPNAPGHWIVYERDGRTRHAEVFTARTADRERRYISQVIVYRSDTPSRRYVCSQDGVVQYEDRFNADGSTTTINARDGVLQPR